MRILDALLPFAVALSMWGAGDDLKPFEPSASGWVPGNNIFWGFDDNLKRKLHHYDWRTAPVWWIENQQSHCCWPFWAYWPRPKDVGNMGFGFMYVDHIIHEPCVLRIPSVFLLGDTVWDMSDGDVGAMVETAITEMEPGWKSRGIWEKH